MGCTSWKTPPPELADYYEHKYQEQALKKLKRQAAKLGMQLVPAAA